MAITPGQTDELTEIEKSELVQVQIKIDEALRRQWEKGRVVCYALRPQWRDEFVRELVKIYNAAGWTVEVTDKGILRFWT